MDSSILFPVRGEDVMDPLTVLPAEVCQDIFLRLCVEDIDCCLHVCETWAQALDTYDKLWRTICHRKLSYCSDRMKQDRSEGFTWRVRYFNSVALIHEHNI